MRLNKSEMAILLSIMILLTGVLTTTANGEVPRLIQYQGRLTDDIGNPLDTTVDLTFAIFTDSTGGGQIWKEVRTDIVVADGLFNVLMGSVTSFGASVFDGNTRWLGVAVGEGDVMYPLTPVVSTAYAIRSQYAGHADTADFVLGGSSSGWVHNGNNVYLSDINDSVGIGVTDPLAPLEVEGPTHGIIGNSLGSGTAAGVLGTNNSDGFGLMGVSTNGRGVTGLSTTGFGGHFWGAKNFFNQNLGIGTENPEEMLHIYKNSSGGGSFIKIQADHASNWGETGIRIETPQNRWHFRMDDDLNGQIPAGAIGLRSNSGGEVMTWREQGSVGIGTTSPNYPLEVVSSGNTLRARCTGSGIGVYSSSSSGFGVYSDATKNFMGGLTGFGQTNPTHRVTVNGSVAFQGSGTTRYHFGYLANGLNLAETSVADYRLFIKDGGNVGIGTNNPQAKLHVSGDAKVGGTITANGMMSTSITDEAGLAAGLNGSTGYLNSSWTAVRTRTIGVPGPGYVVAISAGYSYIDHGLSGVDKLEYGISALPSDVPTERRMWLRFADNADAGGYWLPITVHNVFEVTSAGDHTYYMLARRAEGDNYMWIDGCSLILMYFPTAYGTVTTVADASDNPPITVPGVSAEGEPKEVEMSAILARMESLSAEMESLKDLVKAVENK